MNNEFSAQDIALPSKSGMNKVSPGLSKDRFCEKPL